MSQWYEDNTKRPKLWGTQLEIIKFYTFCGKIQQNVLGPGKSDAVVMFQSMRIHQKSCYMFPLKFAAALLNCSRKGTVRV